MTVSLLPGAHWRKKPIAPKKFWVPKLMFSYLANCLFITQAGDIATLTSSTGPAAGVSCRLKATTWCACYKAVAKEPAYQAMN